MIDRCSAALFLVTGLLGLAVGSSAAALELIMITRQKLGHLMQDAPETIMAMLREILLLLGDADKLVEWVKKYGIRDAVHGRA